MTGTDDHGTEDHGTGDHGTDDHGTEDHGTGDHTTDDAAGLWSRPALLAAELVRGGAHLVVTGGTARRLRAGSGRPGDLDVIVAEEAVPALVRALGRLGVRTTVGALLRGRTVRRGTGWGPLDVFVRVPPPAVQVRVGGVAVPVEAEDRPGGLRSG